MYYYSKESKPRSLQLPKIELDPRDISFVEKEIQQEKFYFKIWTLIRPYFIVPSWAQNFDRPTYQKICSLLIHYPSFLKDIVHWPSTIDITEQLFDLIAFSNILELPKNPNFIEIQNYLEERTHKIIHSSLIFEYQEQAKILVNQLHQMVNLYILIQVREL